MTIDALSPARPAPQIAPGTRLNGIYEVDGPLASGGMGEVYRGHAIQTGHPVAIKVIRADLAENAAAMALFRKEAAALHNLHHEAIVRYYVFTVDPVINRFYLAMDFVDGPALSDRLASGPLPFEAVRLLQRRLAAGLQAAHERGVVHRDLSPDNVIIRDGDVARATLIDFGIARSTRVEDGTVIGSGFAGKLNYVSPEQLGLFGGEVTAKSDIYSLGLVLAEALTGRALDMGGSHAEILEKRQHVPDLSHVDARLRPLLEAMLQPNPADRPASMAAVASWPESSPVSPRPQIEDRTARGRRGDPMSKPSSSRSGPAAAKPRRGAVLAAVLGGTALGAVALTVLLLREPASDTRPPPPALESATPAAVPPPPGETDPTPSVPPTVPPGADLSPPAPPVPPRADLPPLAPPRADLPPPASPPAPSGGPDRPTETAGLALPPASVGARPPTRAEQVTRFIKDYPGGDCFFISPLAVSDNAASIEAFGAEIPPFRALDQEFQRAHGFEAEIGLRQVTAAQCPAVTFLDRLRAGETPRPRLELGASNLRNGGTLTGAVEHAPGEKVALLLVADDGSVRSIPAEATSGSRLRFSTTISRGDVTSPRPQMVVAIASAQPLPSLRAGKLPAADQLFPRLIAEAGPAARTLSAASGYVRLER